jgi:hypothetical protein
MPGNFGIIAHSQAGPSSTMKMLQSVRFVFAAIALLGSGVGDASADADWLADFEALKAGLARNYANFEYTLTDRRIDLPAIATRYREALAIAASDGERREVFERLLRDFRDPHVSIVWPSHVSSDRDETACPSDFAAAATGGGVQFHRLPVFEPLTSSDAQTFRAGLLRAPGGRRSASSESACSCTRHSRRHAWKRLPMPESNAIRPVTTSAST